MYDISGIMQDGTLPDGLVSYPNTQSDIICALSISYQSVARLAHLWLFWIKQSYAQKLL